MKFPEISSNGSLVDPRWQTGLHGKANSRFFAILQKQKIQCLCLVLHRPSRSYREILRVRGGDMRQVLYWGPTNIRRHSTELSRVYVHMLYILYKLRSNLGISVCHLLLFLYVWSASQPTIGIRHLVIKRLEIHGKIVALPHVSARYWYVSCTQLNLVVASKSYLVGTLNTVMCLSQNCLWIYEGCSESKERLRIQPAQLFHCTRSVICCVQ